ncbi:hypothetical protein TNCV_1792381 [Trichonephila clavipes]|nr:hypothetical protein TNCV_1792381 [Trichonephila clavipes]
MHLPTSELGSMIKAGSCFNSTIVPAASSVLQSPSSYSFQLQKKKKKKSAASLFRLRFGAPRTRFGAVKPPFLALLHSCPRNVLLSRFRLAASSSILPPAGECIQISIFIATFSPRIWV